MNKNESNLLYLLTLVTIAPNPNIDFGLPFWTVTGDLFGMFLFTIIMTYIVYHIVSKPLYKYLTK